MITDGEFIEFLDYIKFLSNRDNNYEQIKIDVEDFLDKNHFNNENCEYHYFKSELEEILFDSLISHEDNVVVLKEDYVAILNIYSNALFELGHYSKAKSVLKLARDINPFDIDVLINLVRIYDVELNYECIYLILMDALKIVYDIDDLLRIYRVLGQYFYQIGEKKIGNLLLNLISYDSFKKFDINELKILFAKYGIQLGFNEELLSAYQFYYGLVRKKGDFTREYIVYQDYWELCEFNEMFE